MNGIPRWAIFTVLVLVVASWIPMALVVRARTVRSEKPPIHLFSDMDNQPRYKAQMRNRLFADRRAMRPQVEGTVARGRLHENDALVHGRIGEEWIMAVPLDIDRPLLERGRERYDIFCSPCHGLAGYGDGPVAKRADSLQEGTWTLPSSFHTELVRSRPAGHLYNTIANGIRSMPAYGQQIAIEDRWAIVAYVRALQKSQHADVEDVPADLRASLR